MPKDAKVDKRRHLGQGQSLHQDLERHTEVSNGELRRSWTCGSGEGLVTDSGCGSEAPAPAFSRKK